MSLKWTSQQSYGLNLIFVVRFRGALIRRCRFLGFWGDWWECWIWQFYIPKAAAIGQSNARKYLSTICTPIIIGLRFSMGNLFPQPCSPHYLQNLRNFPPSHPIIITPLPSNRNFSKVFRLSVSKLHSSNLSAVLKITKKKLLTVQNLRPKGNFLPKSVIDSFYNPW